MSESPWERIRSASLSTKLILFSALLTALAVGVAFAALSMELRKQTRRLLAGSLAQHQRTLLEVQRGDLEDLLRASTLMSGSPTLRAAMETYHAEASPRARRRADLLATIQREAGKIAGGLGRDLLIVTDRNGRVLAATGRLTDLPAAGEDLSARTVVRHALSQEAPVGDGNFSVLRIGGGLFQVGCVPIVLQGYIIGTLTVGDWIDEAFVDRLHRSFDSDVVVTAGGSIVASSLPLPDAWAGALEAARARAGAGARIDAPAGAGARNDAPVASGPPVVSIGRHSYVTAPLVLGRDESGGAVTLHLLQSLDRAMAEANRSLLAILLGYGTLVALVAGLCASVVARSLLSPLQRFVAFMRSAGEGDRTRRFDPDAARAGAEVRLLSTTFERLMESLRAHEARLVEKAKDDMERMERLKESEKLAALGRMLSGAAHEINNPLAGVVGNIEMLLAHEKIDGKTRERLETVRKEGRRIVDLVRNLLKVARRDTGERVAVDLNQVVRDSVALRRHDFERAGLRLVLDLSPGPLRLAGSELELQQVCLNIINNAHDALREGKGGKTLTIRTAEGDEGSILLFSDDGPGIAHPGQVFETFYTTKPVGQGTGLGLSITRTIVENHGGRITAANGPGGGAEFRIILPRGDAAATAAPAPVPQQAAATPGARRSLPISVLVVDDEPVVLDLQMAILDSIGARPTGVRSGEAAIEALGQRDFDLIVSDLFIPGKISGEALYRHVAEQRRAGARGFLFVTGDSTKESGFPQEVGARCVLKPFSMEEYVTALQETWNELSRAA